MDPTLRNRTLATLKGGIPDLPRGLRMAAKYVVDHPSDFGLDPIRDTARKAGVSTYTLVRLAERLGFASFDALRDPFRQALVSSATGDRPGWVARVRDAGGLGRVQAEAALNGMAIVQRSLEQADPVRMARVVDLLTEAPNVFLTATRASYGLAYYLHYVGRMALPSLRLIPRHMGSPVDELHSAQPGDVMIALTFTPYSRETIDACKFARRKGVRLVMITDSEIVSPEFQADETLLASVLSTHHFCCYAGAMALIETLIAMLVARGGTEAKERITSYEALRQETQAYWAVHKKQ
ncbi:MurR/RpiR family transcriptional regulator [Antarctobacter heliothermus]|uniref:Transcriptional regulator, RpiR family n=1 Tax=Antarctobacter heliothermus TaxID=74033 RepID=A0A239ED17_9RHOB|nr:MurR/RpiR family transcriptional regulator [Antarctobacter heliothermus]SNS41824.1 transcriptional regulator, RpiR family [Antarctobacter heliothermus]